MEDYPLLGVRNSLFNIEAYLHHARTVDPQKYVNTSITQPKEGGVFSVRAVPSRTALDATQSCGKHISAAGNRHVAEQRLCIRNDYATVNQSVFSPRPFEGL
jgi:hypothetical protein